MKPYIRMVGLLLACTGASLAQEPAKVTHDPGFDQQIERAQKELMMQEGFRFQPEFRYQKSSGRWWSNPETAQKLHLTPDQLKKMDDIFQQNRLKLIDLNASLQKEEAIMEPLVAMDQPDDAKVLAQIDRIAQARAELEKANSRMLWLIRRVLTPDQWSRLQGGNAAKPRPVK